LGESELKYWAFISYSHADEAWAVWLHRALERFRIPGPLVGTRTAVGKVPRRLFPVFRDRDELAGSAQLGPELQRALRASRTQIVICSPRAAASRWVEEEIRYFRSLGRADRIFAVIVDGQPNALEKGDPDLECFPPSLRGPDTSAGPLLSTNEPVAVDARPQADGKANAALRLIAGILGLGFDDLRQRELQARNRRLGLMAGLAGGVAAVTAVLAIQAYQARDDALRRQRQAEDLIEFMLGDLRSRLEPIGRLAILDAVGQKALEYFATLDVRDQTDTALASQARALRQIGEVRLEQGDLSGASQALNEAERLNAELLKRFPDDVRLLQEMAESEYALGNAYYHRGELDDAALWLQRNGATVARLAQLEPDEDMWLSALADADGNLGAIAFQRGEHDEARRLFLRASETLQRLIARDPGEAGFVQLLSNYHGWLAVIENEQGRLQAAAGQAEREVELRRALLQRDPDAAGHRSSLVAAMTRQLSYLSRLEPLLPEAPILVEGLALARGLAETDPDSIQYQRLYRSMLGYLQEAHIRAGQFDAAVTADRQALSLARELYGRAPDHKELRNDLLLTYARSIKLAILSENASRARQLLAEALSQSRAAQAVTADLTDAEIDILLSGWYYAAHEDERARFAGAVAGWRAGVDAGQVRGTPELMWRHALLTGDSGSLRRWSRELTPVQRSHPFLQMLCAGSDRCDG
jgi:eukaryotic-like serine/threonine-protein kinase